MITIVLLLTFVLLTVVFRSIVVDGTAVALDLLSVERRRCRRGGRRLSA